MTQHTVWLGLFAVLTVSQTAQGILNASSVIIHPDGFPIYPCQQVNHRVEELESSLMGQWYAIEIIQHRDDEKTRGSQTSDICPKVNLYRTTSQDIRMMWHEKAGDVHYNFRLVDAENSGYWMMWGKQNGSMVGKGYQQFAGSVQVLEAQPSRMVLTFCSKDAHHQTHYSVIMVRNITVPHDTTPVHTLLVQHNLYEYGVRQMCKGSPDSAASQTTPTVTMALSSALLMVSLCWQTNLV